MTSAEILAQLHQTQSRSGDRVWTGELDGFEIRIEMRYDDYSPDHYGDFCEKERPPKWAWHGATFVRNPNVWRKRDEGNGTDSWFRTSTREFGWFAWAWYKPEDEVALLMEGGMPERAAWDKVNEQIRHIVAGLANGDIHNVVLEATASREYVELGSSTIGGIELDSRDSSAQNDAALRDNFADLVHDAIETAKHKLKSLCGCR